MKIYTFNKYLLIGLFIGLFCSESFAQTYKISAVFQATGTIEDDDVEDSLPMEWLAFTANEINGQIQINWLVTNEIETSGYSLEWSLDGKDWTEITFQNANNQLRTNEYEYLHLSPSIGTNYYRIQQKDIDGTSSYSTTISVFIQKHDITLELQLYPNPTSGEVELIVPITFNEQEPVQLLIYNQIGQLIEQQNWIIGAAVNIHHLPANIYHLIAKQGDLQSSSRIIKVE